MNHDTYFKVYSVKTKHQLCTLATSLGKALSQGYIANV